MSGIISFEFEYKKAAQELNAIARIQLPYAMSVAINRTLNDVKTAEQEEMKRVFDNPTPWALNSIQIKYSNKANLHGEIKLKDFAGKGIPATKFLKAEIEGGSRAIKRSERWLQERGLMPQGYRAVPGQGAKLDKYGNITGGKITQILSYLGANPISSANTPNNKKHKKKAQYFAVGVNDNRIYALTPGIYERIGKGVKPIMIFVKSVSYKARYNYVNIGESIARRVFPQNFERAMTEAMGTARRGSFL
jgi:hypothetical protein